MTNITEQEIEKHLKEYVDIAGDYVGFTLNRMNASDCYINKRDILKIEILKPNNFKTPIRIIHSTGEIVANINIPNQYNSNGPEYKRYIQCLLKMISK